VAKPKKPRAQKSPQSLGVKLADLIAAGMLSPPLRLYRRYKGRLLEARLSADGKVEFGGQLYPTCSTAAEYARSTVTGRRMSTNGWSFWQFDAGAGKPKTLEETRAEFLASKAPSS
jgi:hypothetical protein